MSSKVFFTAVLIVVGILASIDGLSLSNRFTRPIFDSDLLSDFDFPNLFDECKYEGVSVAETASSVDDLSILVEALTAADLVDTLADKDFKGTVFAPKNDAFVDLLELLGLSKEELFANKDLLTKVLLLHVSPDVVIFSKNLFDGQVFETLEGSELVATGYKDDFYIFSPIKVASKVVIPDVAACNAVVHVIDRVLLPAVEGLPSEIPVPAEVFEVPYPNNLCRVQINGNLLVTYRCEKFQPGFLKIVNVWN
eukprot:TRINITY_DN2344_c0_g1_i1.p1 TRINITY_DN2344_c0_g1~~TRINITY_DN2344_c0_g1_i1.p1  ORF type:complete len:252 (+),score=34.69 TRINITY_DN2344_c0_g1_i1:112-867(+)